MRMFLFYIQLVSDVMNRANWHQYQVLTKRAERVRKLSTQLKWAPHIWMGVMDEAVAWVKHCLNPMLGPSEIEIRPTQGIDDFQ
jgi:protein gp37